MVVVVSALLVIHHLRPFQIKGKKTRLKNTFVFGLFQESPNHKLKVGACKNRRAWQAEVEEPTNQNASS